MEYRNRAAPCSQCGDVVLIAVKPPLRRTSLRGKLPIGPPGWRESTRRESENRLSLEHADPGPDGESFDGVDDQCRRPRVR